MTITIHAGVNDLPYPSTDAHPKTTGRVAELLEERYHIIETFLEIHKEEINQRIAEAGADAVEAIASGAPADEINFMADVESWLEHRFRDFLASREIEALGIPGVPTQAARKGRSRRFSRGRNPMGSRPSFIDTGLYQSSFMVWIDNG